MKLSDGFNGADLRNVCTEAGSVYFYLGLYHYVVKLFNSLRGLVKSLTSDFSKSSLCLIE